LFLSGFNARRKIVLKILHCRGTTANTGRWSLVAGPFEENRATSSLHHFSINGNISEKPQFIKGFVQNDLIFIIIL
jgi:hypothetical protein